MCGNEDVRAAFKRAGRPCIEDAVPVVVSQQLLTIKVKQRQDELYKIAVEKTAWRIIMSKKEFVAQCHALRKRLVAGRLRTERNMRRMLEARVQSRARLTLP